MFTMDVPYIPAQETPVVLAQAAAPATLQPDYMLKLCAEIESTGNPRSAGRAVDPAQGLAIYLQNRDHRVIELATMASIKPILLEGTAHGTITSGISNYGRTTYHYDPIPNYTGNDRAVFLAEFEGKVYKIVVNLVVSPTVGESPLMEGEEPVCPPPQLIKVNGKPVSSSLEFGPGYSLDSLSVTFADLTGGAVGQTIGEGVNANITLDTNAAGHNWYIDTTPWDNSEYLPTSNPYEWVAKAGTAAYGKMDMLSVLLHVKSMGSDSIDRRYFCSRLG